MAAGAAVLVTVALVSAQERRETQDQNKAKQKTERESRDSTTQSGRDQAGRGRSQGDDQLVMWLASENEGEIALGKFASERAQNDEVKEFAQMMVKDHSEFLNKLHQIAPTASKGGAEPATAREQTRTESDKRSTTRKDEARPDESKRTQPKADAAQTKPADDATIRRSYADPERGTDLLRIKQEIAKQCLETSKKELGEKSGADFDKCYMGQQIMAHLGMADTLKVVKNYASPELKQLLEDGEKAVQGHLAHAKVIMKQIDGEGEKQSSKSEK
jgi:predicted outer membrane protein